MGHGDRAHYLGDTAHQNDRQRCQPAQHHVFPLERQRRQHEQHYREQPACRAEVRRPQLRTLIQIPEDDPGKQQRERVR